MAFVDRSFWEEVTPNESTLLSDVPVGTLYDEDGRAERIVGGSTPGQVVLGLHEPEEQASEQHSFVVSASVPASRYLLGLLP